MARVVHARLHNAVTECFKQSWVVRYGDGGVPTRLRGDALVDMDEGTQFNFKCLKDRVEYRHQDGEYWKPEHMKSSRTRSKTNYRRIWVTFRRVGIQDLV